MNIIKHIFVIITLIVMVNVLSAIEYNSYPSVKVQILNKVTGKVKIYNIPINNIINVDEKLSILVRACHRATQKYSPEDVMFLQVAKASEKVDAPTALLNNTKILNRDNIYLHNSKSLSTKDDDENKDCISLESKLIFSGWIFSNHPDISSLTDPQYDITIVKCLN